MMQNLATQAILLTFFLHPLNAEKAPLPKPIQEAKTVFLLNTCKDIAVFDRFYNDLKKWGRFSIVESQEKADLIFVVGTGTGRWGIYEDFSLQIIDPKADRPIYMDSAEGWWTNKGAASKLVRNLKNRMPKKPAPND